MIIIKRKKEVLLFFIIITTISSLVACKGKLEEDMDLKDSSYINPQEYIYFSWFDIGQEAVKNGYNRNIDLSKLPDSILSLDGIYIIEEISTKEERENYRALSGMFIEYLENIGEKNLEKNRRNIDFISLHRNWIKNDLKLEKDILLSTQIYNEYPGGFTLTSEKKSEISFETGCYDTPQEYIFAISQADERKKVILDFLGKENTIEYENNLEINFLKSSMSMSYPYYGSIDVNTRSIEFSLTHELVHVYLKISDRFLTNGLPNAKRAEDYYHLSLSEGLCDYALYFLDDTTIERVNNTYLNSIFTTEESYYGAIKDDYRRNKIVEYLDYKDDTTVKSEEYIDALATLSLTDLEFLRNSKNFYATYGDLEEQFLNSYEEAASFVRYLIEEQGREKFLELLLEKATSEELYAASMKEIKDSWITYLKIDKSQLVDYRDL